LAGGRAPRHDGGGRACGCVCAYVCRHIARWWSSKQSLHTPFRFPPLRCTGRSLHSLLYSTLKTEDGAMMRPSVAWLRLRRETAGRLLLRRLVRDATAALAGCHRLNLTHRDLKPPNLIVDLTRSPTVRLADFGSAVDDVTLAPLHGLYPRGPSVAEETVGYQPPESALGGIAFDPADARTCVQAGGGGSGGSRAPLHPARASHGARTRRQHNPEAAPCPCVREIYWSMCYVPGPHCWPVRWRALPLPRHPMYHGFP